MNRKVSYWWDQIENDLAVAKTLLAAKHHLYVAFLCHLVIEKSLKGAIAALGSDPPRIHNLTRLATLADLLDQMNAEQLTLLDDLEPMNIEGRYPRDREKLTRKLDAKRCAAMLAQTEELSKWIRTR